MNLTEAIQRLVENQLPPMVVTGIVKSVDKKTMTCVVNIPNKPTRYDVRLRAVIDNVEKGILIIPKLNSKVIIECLEGRKTASYVSMFSEVESIKLIGDDNGGLVIGKKLAEKINAIEDDLNDLKLVFKNWAPSPAPDGGASLKLALARYINATINKTKESDIESKTIDHG